jgi:hypothetical protein
VTVMPSSKPGFVYRALGLYSAILIWGVLMAVCSTRPRSDSTLIKTLMSFLGFAASIGLPIVLIEIFIPTDPNKVSGMVTFSLISLVFAGLPTVLSQWVKQGNLIDDILDWIEQWLRMSRPSGHNAKSDPREGSD